MNTYGKILIEQAAFLRGKKTKLSEGSVSWTSPSNIAIVKYWGKYPGQIPANASLSLTLSKAVSKTQIDFKYSKKISGPALAFEFEGKKQPDFANKISKFLNTLLPYLPWLQFTTLSIQSENTFPHSSGIASSASAMSALAAALCNIEALLFESSMDEDFKKKTSFIARLGSGSAARSVYGKMAVWGLTSEWAESSDEFAVPVNDIHENFLGMKDSILIIESGKKQVSSSMGHELMKSNPYAKLRFEAAERNMQLLNGVLKRGDFAEFIDIMENEALSLHAMMMTSTPGFILMKANTLAAIEKIRAYRNNTGRSVGFTLDAGANVHILYPKAQDAEIKQFIESELIGLCENGVVLHDEMGGGAK